MRGIFISYRRDDSEGQSGRLFEDLADRYGRDAVSMDVTGLRKGMDLWRAIEQNVGACGVLLVMIGQDWLRAADAAGQRRLDDPSDFVRLETAAALRRDIPVVPVLVQGARMPRADELPPDLKELADRNGTELTHAHWASDVAQLIDDLRPYVEMPDIAARQNGVHSKPGELRPAMTASSFDGALPDAAPKASRGRWLAALAALAVIGVIAALGLGV